jgi:hypothetical protein
LTLSQHTALFAWMQELLMTNINYLLPCHCHLLNQDFHQLGNADTLPCQLWVASIESAISAASHVASGHYTPGSMQIFNSRPDAPQARHDLTKRLYPPLKNPTHQNEMPHSTNPPILILASNWSTTYATSSTPDTSSRPHRDTIPPPLEEKIEHSPPGLVKPECIHNWTRTFTFEHFIALVRLLCLHGGKERQKFVWPETL